MTIHIIKKCEVLKNKMADEYAEAPPAEEAPQEGVSSSESKTQEIGDSAKEKADKATAEANLKKVDAENRGSFSSSPEDRKKRFQQRLEEEERERLASWKPKTKLGMEVREGKIKNLDEILDSGRKIMESEIVDLVANIQSDLIFVGQSKGKFGGGKRRVWRQTQRKTREGNVPTFSTMAVVGDENGHVGVGEGKSKETLPARDKATKKAKLNIFRIKRDCAGFDCACSELHSVPFKVTGKSGSVSVTLIPAPQGTGLVVANELKKILKLAGIKDVYSQTSGKRRTTFNLIKACVNALKKTNPENAVVERKEVKTTKKKAVAESKDKEEAPKEDKE